MKVVIIARTRQGSGDCVDAVTFDGRALRLIAADDASDSRPNPGYEIGEVWEIEAAPEENPVPPHVENRVLTAKRRLGSLSGLDQFVDDRCPPVRGGIDALFDGLTQPNGTGALYIAERSGIPGQSVMFWRPDRPLPRDQHAGRIRYRYLNETGGHTLAFIGFQEPLEEIPAGTLLRVSLAQWWRPALHPETEARCYVQLSGWILPEGPDGSPIHPIDPGHSRARPVIEPPWELLEEEIDPELPPPAIQGPAGRTGADIDLTHTLREVFGFPAFRPLQHEIIRNLMDRRDTLAVMPTGSGKSLCYQLPALLQPGLTVVASPLISLMEDQVVQLREWGIPAVYLNSSLDYGAYLEATRAVRSGETRLVYAAPETLVRQETILLLEKTGVDLFVIDEAHCISEWGHDFRPEYRRLAEVRGRLSDSVTLAVTATATDRVRADIMESLDIRGANLFIGSFDRPNLHLDVKDKLGGFEQARNFLEGHRGEAGIVYCATRNMVDDLAAELAAQGYPALPYHAGMSAVDRRRNQHRFRYEEGLIVVATIAFGMGIDKPDVRFVLHFDLPKNLESYYQQIGRAGRDGLPADCLLLYSYSDVHTIRYFMPADDPERRRQEEARLKTFLSFVEATGCRRPALLDYFGETYPQARCGNCDRCEYRQALESGPGDETGSGPSRTDLAEPARWFLETARLTNEIFGAAHLIDILRGSRAKKVLDKKHDRVKTYGIGSVFSKEHWRLLSGVFLREGLVRRTPPHGSLKITDRGEAVLAGGEFVTTHPDAAVHSAHAGSGGEYDPALFEKLRGIRAALARELAVPPYVIFHDRSLAEMAARLPQNVRSLAGIYGVGRRKIKQYGERFLSIIREHCLENKLEPPSRLSRPAASQSLSGLRRTEKVRQLYSEGCPIREIAEEMGFTTGTILGHLDKAVEAGMDLHPDGLIAFSMLDTDERQRVRTAFLDHGTQYLKPVFDALGESVSYEELKLWRLIVRVSEPDRAR